MLDAAFHSFPLNFISHERPDFAVSKYNTHLKAEGAVKKLQHAGYDMKKRSIVGKDYHT